jgi:hypothetical protein
MSAPQVNESLVDGTLLPQGISADLRVKDGRSPDCDA